MRFLISLLVALIIGAGVGLYLGWVQFPAQVIDNPMSNLDARYQDEYTVMIAYGFLADRNLASALERLQRLDLENAALTIQETAERYISSSRTVEDIRALVTLAEGVGRLTPLMEPYRLVNESSPS